MNRITSEHSENSPVATAACAASRIDEHVNVPEATPTETARPDARRFIGVRVRSAYQRGIPTLRHHVVRQSVPKMVRAVGNGGGGRRG